MRPLPQRPVALTDGSLTKKCNKTGVRLWTDRSIRPLSTAPACMRGVSESPTGCA
jgi:hypothetical protein